MLSTKPLGPTGFAAPFSNSRQGDRLQTLYEIGRQQFEPEFDPGNQLINKKKAEEARTQTVEEILGFIKKPIQPPEILPASNYPKGWSPLALSMGFPLKPLPTFKRYMPHELDEIVIYFAAPDITQRDGAVVNRPIFFDFNFANGKTIKIDPSYVPAFDVDKTRIAELDKKTPISPYAPSLGNGTLNAIIMSNLRLLFGLDFSEEVTSTVPIQATFKNHPPTLSIDQMKWGVIPGHPEWPVVKHHLDDVLTSTSVEVAAAIQNLARTIIAEGIYLARETYDDV